MGLTLEEAIEHARNVAKEKRHEATYNFPALESYYDNCLECAEEHEQLAAWLEELKKRREEKSKTSDWIPVSKKIPDGKASTNYLVSIKGYGVDIANYVSTTNEWYCFGMPCEVTAWMPMLNPYQEADK